MGKIYIGDNNWIKWNKVDSKEKRIVEIDYILESTETLWLNLQFYCVAECCGIMAFSFDEKDVLEACKNLNVSEIVNKLELTLTKLSEINEQIISSKIINQVIDKTVFENLIKHLLNTLSSQ